MKLYFFLHILAICAFAGMNHCYRDNTDLLKTVALYYYNPFYNDEQVLQKNYPLNRFSAELPTKVLIHGYIANRYHSSIEPIKNAYQTAADVNLIVVDWSKGAFQPYDVSRGLVGEVAVRVAEILDNLISNYNLDKNSVHIIGHSLGSHIAGGVGRYFHGQLGRITGLDPAAPLFFKWSRDAIRETDGRFVDIIHTCGEALGEIWPRGHIDFYPNNGLPSQPGCNLRDALTLFSCSHFRASDLFAESILIPSSFVAVECAVADILAKESCKSKNGEAVIMGEYVPHEARGTWYLRTYAIPPYGRGNNSELFS